jgi:hypothetical protein
MTWTTALRRHHGGTVERALEDLHRDERALAALLEAVADRHRSDHEVFHVARDLARWSREHVTLLAEAGPAHGLDLDPDVDRRPGPVGRTRQRMGEAMARHRVAGLVLLTDLRKVHRSAGALSLDWEILAQAAQALKDRDLLALAQECHPQTLRQVRWANGRIKETAPQVMAAR